MPAEHEQTRRVYILLPERQINAIERLAAKLSRTRSSLIREAISDMTGVEDTVTMGGDRRVRR